jgi:hypothetical protein
MGRMVEWDFDYNQLDTRLRSASFSIKMVCPLSQTAADSETRIQRALADLGSGKYKTPHAAALAHGVSTSTMSRRAKGGLS